MAENAIEVQNLKKIFSLPHDKATTLKQKVISFGKQRYENLRALESVSFKIRQGEFFGIIGRNGSGKSTLLKMLAGIYTPTSGHLKINGQLTPFIELGIGFNPELTGKDNVYLNGAILGLTKKEIEARYEDIVDFAELEKFMDQKLKNYSSGMQVRLAFAIAIQAHNDILLIDEILAVGDIDFQRKCYEVFEQLKKIGRTVVFVSHDLPNIHRFCDRVMILDKGRFEGIHSPIKAIQLYTKIRRSEESTKIVKASKKLKLVKAEIIDQATNSQTSLAFNEKYQVSLKVSNPDKIPLGLGVAIYRKPDNLYCFGTNTAIDSVNVPAEPRINVALKYDRLSLINGDYYLKVGLFTPECTDPIIMYENALDFSVYGSGEFGGVAAIGHKWELSPQVEASKTKRKSVR